MTKKTWVNVGGTWKNVKNIWLNVGGVWIQKVIPKVNIGGIWKEFIQYLYTLYKNGVETVIFSKGYSMTGGTTIFEKQATRYRIHVYPQNGTLYVNSDSLVDVTSYSQLKMLCTSNNNVYPLTGVIGLATSKTHTGDLTVKSEVGGIKISPAVEVSVDITSLSGSYYIVIGNKVVNGQYQNDLYVTDIWLE
jgi:hypothetical protein